MSKLERLLVPIDFSAYSSAAARLGFGLAAEHGAKVTLMHADMLPMFGPMYTAPAYWYDNVYREHEQDLNERIETDRQELLKANPGVACDVLVVRGGPSDSIAQLARELAVDLIVMGSHARSGLTRFLLGSVAEQTARRAPCPVLVTRSIERTEAAFRCIVVGVDFSDFSAPCAELAALLLAPGGRLELVHMGAAPKFTGLEHSVSTGSQAARAVESGKIPAADMLRRFERSLELEVPISSYVGVGSPPAGILQRAAEIDADLIVVGAHGREGVQDRVLGTVADRVLRRATTHVLLVPSAALERASESGG